MSTSNEYFNFSLNPDNKSYSISAKDKDNIPNQIEIPREYNNLPVTNIQNHGFTGCINITKITIPNSIMLIETQAFKDCTNLLIVEFKQNSKLEYMGKFVFENCINLESIVLPKHVTIIKEGAFYNCEKLQKIYIKSENPPVLEYHAFCKTSKILNIYVPKKSICIYICSHNWCRYSEKFCRLPEIIPTDLGYFTFDMKEDENSYIIYAKDSSVLPNELVIPSYYNNKPITDIGEYAFLSLSGTNVQTIILNENLITIGKYSFFGSYDVKEIKIPDSVEKIEDYGLTFSVTTRVRNPLYVFSKSNLEKIIFGDNSRLNYVGVGAFWGNIKVTQLNLPKSVTYIGNNGLGGLGISEINIPENVKYIGEHISNTSINVEKFAVDSNNKYYKVIDDVLYNIDGTVLIDYPIQRKEGILRIGSKVEIIYSNCIFWACQTLKAIILNPLIPPTMNDSEAGLCLDTIYYKGAKIYVPDESLDAYKTNLPWNEYSNMIYSSSIINNEMAIENNILIQYLGNDTDIMLPNEVENINEFAFETANNLKNIYVSEDNQIFTSVDGVLFNKDMTELICYPQGREDVKYEIPQSVKKIGFAAFIYSKLEEVDVYKELEEIGAYAFYSCANLNKINNNDNIDNIKIIDDYAFYFDGLIENIKLESIEYIGDAVFSGCKNFTLSNSYILCFDIKNIILGKNIKYIGTSAILNNTTTTTLTIEALEPPVNNSNLLNLAGIYVPKESLDLYKEQWSKYKDKIYPIYKSIMS